MDPLTIIALIRAGAQAVQEGYNLYESVKGTMSETDAAKVHQALLDAQAITAALRPLVDDALTASAQN